MILDLRKDARDIYQHLAKSVKDYVVNEAEERGPISAICVTYAFDQRGWVIVHFDNRPEHKRDGQMIYSERKVFKRPHWIAVVKALNGFIPADYDNDGRVIKTKPVTIVLPNGTRNDGAKLTVKAFSTILGRLIKDALLKAKKAKLFDEVPKHEKCQLDIEDFNGSWAWPKYEDLGRNNLITPLKPLRRA